jgi:hypothetical protein
MRPRLGYPSHAAMAGIPPTREGPATHPRIGPSPGEPRHAATARIPIACGHGRDTPHPGRAGDPPPHRAIARRAAACGHGSDTHRMRSWPGDPSPGKGRRPTPEFGRGRGMCRGDYKTLSLPLLRSQDGAAWQLRTLLPWAARGRSGPGEDGPKPAGRAGRLVWGTEGTWDGAGEAWAILGSWKVRGHGRSGGTGAGRGPGWGPMGRVHFMKQPEAMASGQEEGDRTMHTTAHTLIVLGAVASLWGCSSFSHGPSRDRTVISSEEIAASEARTAHELIQRLRPLWLQSRGDRSTRLETTILVYQNDVMLGGIETLRGFPSRWSTPCGPWALQRPDSFRV